ncbi:MAG: hypothetical protein GF311_15880 [Candidatus Lokiarchaeota archaeon]|nr:hypothetical protein [Candidatus Lokiarchaeota archaeon]
MYEDLIKIIAILKNLGLSLKNPSEEWNYETRFFLQKITYIAKSLGMDFSYNFGLYLNGPYCSSLANDYYNHPNLVVSLKSDYSLNERELKIQKLLKKEILSNPIIDKHKSEYLEALGTILYLKNEYPDFMDDDIFRKVKELKGYLKDRILIIALNTAKKLNFRDDFLNEKIQEELELWDKAED